MNKQATYIFVHGAWHGAWCFAQLIKKMRAVSLNALAPDLPGHGSAYISPNKVSFDLYVNSLLDLIKQQSSQVILVGHSMAGMVISQVAEEIPDKIAKLVYLTAYLPKNGDSLLDLAKECQLKSLSPYFELDQVKNTLTLKKEAELKNVFYHLAPLESQELALSKLQAQPFEPFKARVSLGERFSSVPKDAIFCEYDRVISIVDQKRMSLNQIENAHILLSDHSPFLSMPDSLMQIITDKVVL